MDNEELSKKAEEFNEYMLKQAAITFSLEGVSRDLKGLIQKKIVHNRNNAEFLSSIVSSIAQSDRKTLKEHLNDKNSLINELFLHLLKEIKITDTAVNIIMQKLLNKESLLVTEKDGPEESNS